MVETQEAGLVRELSTGGQLDNQNLKRIDKNPFIVTDGKLPTLRVTRTYLNTLEEKQNTHSKISNVKHQKSNNEKEDGALLPLLNTETEHADKTDEKQNTLQFKHELSTADINRHHENVKRQQSDDNKEVSSALNINQTSHTDIAAHADSTQKPREQEHNAPSVGNNKNPNMVELLLTLFACIYYPLLAICSLCYGLWTFNATQSFDKYFDSVTTNDPSFVYYETINTQQCKNKTSQKHWEKEKQRRNKIIQSVLKIYCLNVPAITNEQNRKIFSSKMGFDDPLVSYSDYDEWMVSMHALSIILSAETDDIISIKHYESLIVIKFKVRYMTPFKFINENIFSGILLNDVIMIALDESNSFVTHIHDFWNGKNFLSFFGVIDVSRRITALWSVLLIRAMTYLAKFFS